MRRENWQDARRFDFRAMPAVRLRFHHADDILSRNPGIATVLGPHHGQSAIVLQPIHYAAAASSTRQTTRTPGSICSPVRLRHAEHNAGHSGVVAAGRRPHARH